MVLLCPQSTLLRIKKRNFFELNILGLDVSVPELFRPRLARVKSTKTSRSQSREAMATSRAESVPQYHYNTMPNMKRAEVSSGKWFKWPGINKGVVTFQVCLLVATTTLVFLHTGENHCESLAKAPSKKAQLEPLRALKVLVEIDFRNLR